MTTISDTRPVKLRVDGLHKEYRTGRRERTVALDGIDLHVRAGELVCLVAASGCVKSTLLNIVGVLEAPPAGSVTVDGRDSIGPGPDRGLVRSAGPRAGT